MSRRRKPNQSCLRTGPSQARRYIRYRFGLFDLAGKRRHCHRREGAQAMRWRFDWGLFMLAVAAAWGCGARSQQRAYEYMPDMVRDPAYKAFAPNLVTRDGLTMQHPVAGTISRDY